MIGAGLILIKTYPHIKASIASYVFGVKDGEVQDDENRPVGVSDSLESEVETSIHSGLSESTIEISEWSQESLKSYLIEVCSHQNSFPMHTNDPRKKSVFHLMLQMLILYPLSRVSKGILDFNFTLFMFLRSRIMEIFMIFANSFN